MPFLTRENTHVTVANLETGETHERLYMNADRTIARLDLLSIVVTGYVGVPLDLLNDRVKHITGSIFWDSLTDIHFSVVSHTI